MIGRLVVVGLGLIGGSFAKGLRESGLCGEVVGVDLDPAMISQARTRGPKSSPMPPTVFSASTRVAPSCFSAARLAR